MRNVFTSRNPLLPVATTALCALLLLPGVARAQDKDTPAPPVAPAPAPAPAPAVTDKLSVSTVYVGDNVIVRGRDNGELQKKVDLEANDMPIIDAIKKVTEQAGIKCEVDPETPTDKKITVTMKNVPLGIVLSYLTSEGQIGWSYSRKIKNDKQESTIKIGKRHGHTMTFVNPTVPPIPPIDSKQMNAQIAEAMRAAEEAAQSAHVYRIRSFGASRLPDVRVKLDVHNSNIRDSLKDVLKQADVDYALEDDVPDDIKRSFTFENVPLATALDVICRSADIGWTVERTATRVADPNSKDNKDEKRKVMILIGKKYARRNVGWYDTNVSDLLAPAAIVPPVLDEVLPMVQPVPEIAPMPIEPDIDIALPEEPEDAC